MRLGTRQTRYAPVRRECGRALTESRRLVGPAGDIMLAARSLFERQGVAKTTVKDVAAEAGVTRELVYYYFENKQAVIDAVLDDYVEDLVESVIVWNESRRFGDTPGSLRACIATFRRALYDAEGNPRPMIGVLEELGERDAVDVRAVRETVGLHQRQHRGRVRGIPPGGDRVRVRDVLRGHLRPGGLVKINPAISDEALMKGGGAGAAFGHAAARGASRRVARLTAQSQTHLPLARAADAVSYRHKRWCRTSIGALMTILFVNACMRGEQSRTLQLCREYLEGAEDDVVEVDLAALDLKPFDAAMVAYRTEKQTAREWDDPIFALSRQFVEAEDIVIGAPYWDLSFPSALKIYLEYVSVCDLAFHYTETRAARASARRAASPTSPRAAASSKARTTDTSTSAALPRCSASRRRGSWRLRGSTSSASTWRRGWIRRASRSPSSAKRARFRRANC